MKEEALDMEVISWTETSVCKQCYNPVAKEHIPTVSLVLRDDKCVYKKLMKYPLREII